MQLRSFESRPMKDANQELRAKMIRDHAGTWTCIDPVALELSGGLVRLTPGTRFARGTTLAGVDMAAWLDKRLGFAPAAY